MYRPTPLQMLADTLLETARNAHEVTEAIAMARDAHLDSHYPGHRALRASRARGLAYAAAHPTAAPLPLLRDIAKGTL